MPDVMTIEEASEYLQIPVSTLYKEAQKGQIPCQKIGKRWRFNRKALERWMEAMPAAARNREGQERLLDA